MVARDTKYAALEVSSHALDQDRIAGTHFEAAIVTNITQDHFDYHHDAVHYRESKAKLLDYLKPHGLVVLNADDAESAALADRLGPDARFVTFGIERPAHIWATILEESLRGTRFRLHRGAESIEITTSLVGRHNVSNCLAAAAAMERFDISLDEVKAGIEALRFVPGRLERVECGQPFDVFIDYAHTEDCAVPLRRIPQATGTRPRGSARSEPAATAIAASGRSSAGPPARPISRSSPATIRGPKIPNKSFVKSFPAAVRWTLRPSSSPIVAKPSAGPWKARKPGIAFSSPGKGTSANKSSAIEEFPSSIATSCGPSSRGACATPRRRTAEREPKPSQRTPRQDVAEGV